MKLTEKDETKKQSEVAKDATNKDQKDAKETKEVKDADTLTFEGEKN
jgi:hypothetical protein